MDRGDARGTSRPHSSIKAYDIYGLSEIIGPGVAIECARQAGLHIFEDHFYPEIVDPKTGDPLPDGAEGELVFTTLSKRAMPMIRYRTHDITSLITEPCACGRTIRRMHRIGRRSDDMFIIRGINVFPSQVEAALLAVEGTLPHYQIVLTRDKGLDQMEVQVEVTPEVFSDRIRALEALQAKLSHAIENTLGIRVKVHLAEPHSHPAQRGQGQAGDGSSATCDAKGPPMKLTQLSVFLENKPGQISLPCKALAKAEINILTLSLSDTQQFGILRLIVRDWQQGQTVLEQAGCVVNVTEVVAIEVADRPGGLAELLELSSAKGSTSSTCTPSRSAAMRRP